VGFVGKELPGKDQGPGEVEGILHGKSDLFENRTAFAVEPLMPLPAFRVRKMRKGVGVNTLVPLRCLSLAG